MQILFVCFYSDVCLLPGIIDDSPEEECEQSVVVVVVLSINVCLSLFRVWSYKKIQKALFDAVKRGNLKKVYLLYSNWMSCHL
jgi:hypothetical protein